MELGISRRANARSRGIKLDRDENRMQIPDGASQAEGLSEVYGPSASDTWEDKERGETVTPSATGYWGYLYR
jgi:hypothetical protein